MLDNEENGREATYLFNPNICRHNLVFQILQRKRERKKIKLILGILLLFKTKV